MNRKYADINKLDHYELFINTTLDCNLRCWYCYETHIKDSAINNETMSSILCFIENKVKSYELKQISITFFGGEPLLRFHETIRPIVEFTQNRCIENNKIFNICIITNGVLLTCDIIDFLYTANFRCIFQVTFDGNKEFHNKIKKLENGKGTFNTTIKNVMYALSKGFRFIIRFNYSSTNINSFDELVSIFYKYADECIRYNLIQFSYNKVWQEKSIKEINTDNISIKYKDKNIVHDTSFDYCYADRKNSIVINYNGDIFSCTARDFKTENREGILDASGNLKLNSRPLKRI